MRKYYIFGFFFLLLFFGALLVSLSFGAVNISFTHWGHLSLAEKQIMFDLRLPRILTAFLAGGILAVAGFILQSTLKNPLADPYILGITTGSGFFMSLTFFPGLVFAGIFLLPFFSFLGAIISMLILFAILKTLNNYSVLYFILVGIIINSFFGALTVLVLFFNNKVSENILFVLMGSCERINLPLIIFSYCSSFIILAFIFFYLLKKMNVMSQSDEVAYSLGINVIKERQIAIFLVSILIAIAVSISGMIGFVGLVVPHICKIVFKHNVRFMFIISFFMGGIFLIFCDTLCRTLFFPLELPIGVLTSFIGAPFFLWLLIYKKNI
ncbi:MAG: iron ABC transporter permease [Candidatus Margulisiibacteriota bacterium]|jgi:iron complex transport system permease protein